jgi:tetratricopeptide (TPR) repeat protein
MDREPPVPAATGRRRWLVLLLIVLLGAAGSLFWLRPWEQAPTPPDIVPENQEPAVVEAVRRARAQVLAHPRSALAWGVLGQTFLANELEDEASVCFAQAARLDPHDPRWPYFQGGILISHSRQEEALPYLRRAVACCRARGEPTLAPRLFLVESLLALGRLEEAETELQPALIRQPDEERVHYDAGLLAVARQDWQSAYRHFSHCLQSPFTRQKARLQLTTVCRRLGDQAAAARFRQEAERLPKDADWLDPFLLEYQQRAVKKKGRYQLAENLEQAGRFREAADIVRPLTEAYPEDYVTHLTLGKLLAQAGDLEEAEQALRRAYQLAPDKVQPPYYLALLLLKKGEECRRRGELARAQALFAEAAQRARQALTRKPDYGLAHMVLGLSLKYLGQPAEALAALRQAVQCNPERAELHFWLGELLRERGLTAEARRQLTQALELAPPEADWLATARHYLAQLEK